MNLNIEAIVDDFIQAAKLAGATISKNEIKVEVLPAPHTPPSKLPSGKMGVYVFIFNNKCLKVGKVGKKSQARYTSQHYNPNSSRSNLAKSLLKDQDVIGLQKITENNVGDWIKNNVNRINFLLDNKAGMLVLTLLEAFLQCLLHPEYEGANNSRKLGTHPN